MSSRIPIKNVLWFNSTKDKPHYCGPMGAYLTTEQVGKDIHEVVKILFTLECGAFYKGYQYDEYEAMYKSMTKIYDKYCD